MIMHSDKKTVRRIMALPCFALTVDVEDWFHILDSPVAPDISEWSKLESRVEANMIHLLELLDQSDTKATFFWLGWIAERHKRLLRVCRTAGHEIASHGYGHVLPYRVGRRRFREDIIRGKGVLEDILGERIAGFRSPGFGVKNGNTWAFEEICAAGHIYDSSVFPAKRGHGGMTRSILEPYVARTNVGNLVEIPQSVIDVAGTRFSCFGGGYLRLAPTWIIQWGIQRLYKKGRPLVVYIHPREIDLHQPRLSLGAGRRFKYYVNLRTTAAKLEWLCKSLPFSTMSAIVSQLLVALKAEDSSVPIIDLKRGAEALEMDPAQVEAPSYPSGQLSCVSLGEGGTPTDPDSVDCQKTLLLPERASLQRSSVLLSPSTNEDRICISDTTKILFNRKIPKIGDLRLLHDLVARAERRALRVYLLGGTPESCEGVYNRVRHLDAKLKIVGRQHGCFIDDKAIVTRINELDVDILFLALGSFREESWVNQNRAQLRVPYSITMSGSLDILNYKVAWRAHGLKKAKWYYRLIRSDLQRLPRQPLVPVFALIALWRCFCANVKIVPDGNCGGSKRSIWIRSIRKCAKRGEASLWLS